jgi:hypothetical protein
MARAELTAKLSVDHSLGDPGICPEDHHASLVHLDPAEHARSAGIIVDRVGIRLVHEHSIPKIDGLQLGSENLHFVFFHRVGFDSKKVNRNLTIERALVCGESTRLWRKTNAGPGGVQRTLIPGRFFTHSTSSPSQGSASHTTRSAMAKPPSEMESVGLLPCVPFQDRCLAT